jgi:Amt family ammonium transporter
MSIATLGTLILWLGWFGFNPGSTMAVGDGSYIAHIALTTNIAGAFGGLAATITAWLLLGKPDLSMIINGILAGLVAITAGCAFVDGFAAALIGIVGGILVVFAVRFFDRINIDDPVGAISVHLVNGFWGTLAIGLFALGPSEAEGALYSAGPEAGLLYGGGLAQLMHQFLGSLAVGGMIVLLSTIFWYALKAALGIRVSAEEEMLGLDIAEHGMEAYAGFAKDASGMASGVSYPTTSARTADSNP